MHTLKDLWVSIIVAISGLLLLVLVVHVGHGHLEVVDEKRIATDRRIGDIEFFLRYQYGSEWDNFSAGIDSSRQANEPIYLYDGAAWLDDDYDGSLGGE